LVEANAMAIVLTFKEKQWLAHDIDVELHGPSHRLGSTQSRAVPVGVSGLYRC